MAHAYKCPYCGEWNRIEENSDSLTTKILKNLPIGLASATAVNLASAITKKGIGGVILNGTILAGSVVAYIDGKKITCASCKNEYSSLLAESR